MALIAEIAAALDSDRLLFKTLNDGSGVVLDLDGSKVLALNPTGMFVVQRLQSGPATAAELVHALTAEFEVDSETAGHDLGRLLTDLHEQLFKD